jgi:hypothetical protein
MKLDFLFSRHNPARRWHNRKDPQIAPPTDDFGTPFTRVDGEVETMPRLALPPPRLGFGVRQMSPRQLAEWAHEMYISGALDWQEYRFAGFHAELHPDYNSTVGALTGQQAAPDRPRDMVREWEERLAFFHRHNPPHDPQVRRIEKVLALLCTPGGRASVKGQTGL